MPLNKETKLSQKKKTTIRIQHIKIKELEILVESKRYVILSSSDFSQ